MRLQQEQHVPGRRAVRLGAFRGGREMQLGKDDFVETCTMAVCFFLLCVLVVLLRCYTDALCGSALWIPAWDLVMLGMTAAVLCMS